MATFSDSTFAKTATIPLTLYVLHFYMKHENVSRNHMILPHWHGTSSWNPSSCKAILSDSIKPSLFLKPTNETEIKQVISCLKEGAIKDFISCPLTNIVNLPFEQGVFPNELELAIITPLYKAKDPMFFNNYRPISLLSVFSKIIERLMYTRLLDFINKHKILNKLQLGFRNNHSIFMALVVLIENLVNALDSGNCAVGIFLDFQKAFDTVAQDILLDKLYCYGIRGTAHEWFVSYLSSRQQSVMYNGHESELKVVRFGVPLGSTLGPLLFLLYINDLTNVPIFYANTFCWWYQSFLHWNWPQRYDPTN